MAGVEHMVAGLWIEDTLEADPDLMSLVRGVHLSRAPSGVSLPAVIIDLQYAEDINPVGPRRVAARTIWIVRVVAQTNDVVSLMPIASRIDELLHAQGGEVPEGRVTSCRRERPFYLPNVVNGAPEIQLGGIYRVLSR